jgi:hypothetical protein
MGNRCRVVAIAPATAPLLGESLFRKSDILFPADPGKSVEVPPAGIGTWRRAARRASRSSPSAWRSRACGCGLTWRRRSACRG